MPSPLLRASRTEIILQHLESLYEFYGEHTGVRMARKHLGWYCARDADTMALRPALMSAASTALQFAAASKGFGQWASVAAA